MAHCFNEMFVFIYTAQKLEIFRQKGDIGNESGTKPDIYCLHNNKKLIFNVEGDRENFLFF